MTLLEVSPMPRLARARQAGRQMSLASRLVWDQGTRTIDEPPL